MIIMKKGCPYGTHRVIEPKGVLPQPADVIDNTMEIYDNEVLIDVKTLNIDSASFTEIERRANGDVEEIINVLDAGNKGLEPRITRKEIEAFIENEDTDIDALCEKLIGFFERANCTKKTVERLKEMIEEQKAKKEAEQSEQK